MFDKDIRPVDPDEIEDFSNIKDFAPAGRNVLKKNEWETNIFLLQKIKGYMNRRNADSYIFVSAQSASGEDRPAGRPPPPPPHFWFSVLLLKIIFSTQLNRD